MMLIDDDVLTYINKVMKLQICQCYITISFQNLKKEGIKSEGYLIKSERKKERYVGFNGIVVSRFILF